MPPIKSSNMATLAGHSLNYFVPTPRTFNIGDNVEEFLEEIERFYELTETPDQVQKTFIKAFLSPEAAKLFEEVDQTIENYSEKCRKAFEEPSNIDKNLYDALHYRKGDQTASQYFKKIHRLADNIIRHDLSKENLLSFLFQNSIDNIDMKKEIKISTATKSEEIIKKMETIEK